MARQGEGADAPQTRAPEPTVVDVLFTRLENACMNIGRTQAFSQVAASDAASALKEVQDNAQLQQDYLLEQLEQCRAAFAPLKDDDPRIQPDEFNMEDCDA